MTNFLLYKFGFEYTGGRSLFAADNHEEISEDMLIRKFADSLELASRTPAKSIPLYDITRRKDGFSEPEIYSNTVVHSEGGVTLLEVHNNKTKEIMPKDSTEAKKVGHYPWCWVIIDTRPESRAILIQKNDAFKGAFAVARLIENYCNVAFHLSELGWKFTAEKRYCIGKIWDVVRTRVATGRDRVKSLVVKFDEKRPEPKSAIESAFQLIMQQLSAGDPKAEGEFKLSSGDAAQKILDETNADLVAIIDHLIENKYHLKVGFTKSGTYEYGKGAEAIYGVEEKIIDTFGKQMSFDDDGKEGYDLVFWLDKLMPDDESHKYIGRSRRRKRKGKEDDKKEAI